MNFRELFKGFSQGFILVFSLMYSVAYIIFAITGVVLGELGTAIILFVIPFGFSFAVYIVTFNEIVKRYKKK